MELAARVGLTRSVYGRSWSRNLAEALFHIGQWDEAHRLLTRAMDNELANPYASVHPRSPRQDRRTRRAL